MVGSDLVHKPNPPALLVQIQQNPSSLLFNNLHSAVELLTAITPQRAEYIRGETPGMDTDQGGRMINLAFDQGDVRSIVQFVLEDNRVELSENRGEFGGFCSFHKGFTGQPVLN